MDNATKKFNILVISLNYIILFLHNYFADLNKIIFTSVSIFQQNCSFCILFLNAMENNLKFFNNIFIVLKHG